LEYPYIISGDILIDDLSVTAQNAVTGRTTLAVHIPASDSRVNSTASLDPWEATQQNAPKEVVLGPGTIELKKTVVYPEHVTVKIMPGTTIAMAQDVSMFFYGKVSAIGTDEHPIRFNALSSNKPWGAFVLQGPNAADSSFKYCSWNDGSVAEKDLIYYCGMVSMHDVDGLELINCSFGRNHIGDDALHLAYCDNSLIDGCFFHDSQSDAFDIDISSDARILACRFKNIGNDGLDLMTSTAKINDCVFINTGDKGISVGENSSDVEVDDCLFQRCAIGVEVKDRSLVRFGTNLIRKSTVAINLFRKNWRYESGGILDGDIIFAVDCEKNVVSDKYSSATFNELRTTVPHGNISSGV
jgi:hypothetical protein